MNGETTAGETDRALRSESVILDDRLPVKWDGESIHWAGQWTHTADMLFLCGNNGLKEERSCPGPDGRNQWNRIRPHLWKPWSIMGRTVHSRLWLMRCGVCGLTLVEEHPVGGGETIWQLDETDYGPDGSHAVIQGEFDI